MTWLRLDARTLARRLASLLLLAAATSALAAPDKGWTLIQLPGLGPDGGSARAVNNRGEIAGTAHVAPFHPHPALWVSGTVTDLFPGDPGFGVANAINDRGEVAGTRHSFSVTVWRDGVAVALGIAGEPQDIDRFGGVVGFYYPSGQFGFGPQHGFYHRDGVLHDIGTLGNTVNAANGVNDRGVVVGYARLPFSSTNHAVVWEGGDLRDLGTLGGEHSIAIDVNNHGLVVGTSDAADGTSWMFTSGTTGGMVLVLQGASPRAVNDRGAIVGNLPSGQAFLHEDGELTNLSALPALVDGGWQSFAPFDINDRGWIVGVGWRPGEPNAGVPLLLVPPNGPRYR